MENPGHFENVLNSCSLSIGRRIKFKKPPNSPFSPLYYVCLPQSKVKVNFCLTREPLINFGNMILILTFRYNCQVCAFGTDKKLSITVHISSQHLPKVVKCPACPSKFADNSLLKKHTTKVHTANCEECGKKHLRENNCLRCYKVNII